jgi:hypothetical protein
VSVVVFRLAIAMSLVAAAASLVRGRPSTDRRADTVEEQDAATAPAA